MLVSDKNFTREMLIDQYHISEKVIDFLIQLSVFIVVGNGAGPEARMFHSLVENPSLLYLPEQQDDTFIASLYHHLEDFFEDSLGKAIDGYRFYGVQQQKFTITLQPTTSTRKSEGEVKDSCQQEILEMISSFCSSYHDAHYYGS